jgi:hypothetical protein
MTLWYNLWSFGILFPVSVSCTKKNLATPVGRRSGHDSDNVHLEENSVGMGSVFLSRTTQLKEVDQRLAGRANFTKHLFL